MSNIEVIAQLVPKNNANFPIADVNDLKGGYIQVEDNDERDQFLLYTSRLKEGMLCYVKETRRFFQLMEGRWKTWQPSSGATMEITTVDTLAELENTSLENRGQVVFVDEYDTLFYYTGVKWQTFSRIYVQDFPPEDIGSIWIDTTGEGLNESSNVVSELYKLINILARKIHKLEYREQQIVSGEFDNNMYNLYDEIIGIDPEKTIPGLAIEEEEESDGTTEEQDYTEEQLLLNTLMADIEEPKYYKDSLPNVKHIQIKWGTTNNMLKYKDHFLPAELLFCHNTNELYIKHPKTLQLIKIGATGGGGTTPDDPDIEDVMNGIIQNGDYIGSIAFVDMINPNKHWIFGVENGEVSLYNEELNQDPVASGQEVLTGSLYKTPYYPTGKIGMNSAVSSLLFINMIYGSGNSCYNTYNPCNYNFIELSNIDIYHDINLNGYYLHYSEGYFATERKWISLPLKGVIKAGSTYLIKCARSGANKFARIKVGQPDVYFSKGITKNADIFDTNVYSIWDSDGMLKINNNCVFMLTGPCYNTTDSDKYTDAEYSNKMLDEGPYLCSEPWKQISAKEFGLVYGFCDLAGFGKAESTNMPQIAGATIGALSENTISILYYSMDNVSQAYKAVNAANKPNWTTINLLEPHSAIDVTKYTPKNSKEQKNIFFNKHLFTEGKPVFVNCSLGYNPHTTRCFAWVSVGYRDEYLRYRKVGQTEWTTIESFKSGDGRKAYRNRDNKIYNRIRSKTTDGTYFTAHKCIIDLYNSDSNGPTNTETWEYQVGYEDNWTKTRTFTLRNRQTIIDNGFKFVQVTDQQGFNQEEYEEWRVVADYIEKHYTGEYTYEVFDGDVENATFVKSIPEATNDSPEYLSIKNSYQKQLIGIEYSYEQKELPENVTTVVSKTYIQLPEASEQSDQKVLVGDLWSLVEGEYVDVSETTEGFTWPLNPVYLSQLPEVTEDSPEHVIISKYYEKKVSNKYEYKAIETSNIGIKVNKIPETITEESPELVSIFDKYRYKKTYNNVEFTINTGDATQNGNRVNEWVDYFDAGTSLFSHLEQQYSVGNNDLCPVIPYELGLGGDTTKANPININYFFTYEHPYTLPLSTTGEYIPCVYSFIYGNTYFLCMNSEITDAKVDGVESALSLFGQQGGGLYQTIKQWCEEDLTHLQNVNWKIAFCHENPFTLMIKSVMDGYKSELSKDANYVSKDRGSVTSHLNSPGNFWFSKFLEDNCFHLSICGHKHTYTTSRYIHDNPVDRMKPYVYDKNGNNATFITDNNKVFMQVTNDISKWYVKYTMCQASGYKLVSNKELPYENIGWLEEYYPTNGSDKSSGQLYPHFIIWEIGVGKETEDPTKPLEQSRERILGKVKKLYPTSAGSLAAGSNKLFNYNSRVFNADQATVAGGNGNSNPNNNVIVEKLPYDSGWTSQNYTLTWTGDTDKVEGGTQSGDYEENTVIEYPTALQGYTIEFSSEPEKLIENTTINITAYEVDLQANINTEENEEVNILNNDD